MEESGITEEEWKAEIDKVRPKALKGKLTEEQYKRIKYAREKTPPLEWKDIAKLWETWGYDKTATATIQTRYKRYKDNIMIMGEKE